MIETIVASLITGGLALIGVVITNLANARKTDAKLQIAQAVTQEKLEELTRKVREHNHFAQRVPTLEREVKDIKGHIGRLESFHMGRGD